MFCVLWLVTNSLDVGCLVRALRSTDAKDRSKMHNPPGRRSLKAVSAFD